MSLLLTEDSSLLLSESGDQHLLVEPVLSSSTDFPARFMGVAVIIKKGPFWEVDLGRGPIVSKFPDHLAFAAKQAGASGVVYN